MNVLSLFDGMSCGQIALQRANIDYCNYFASEINKQSISITQIITKMYQLNNTLKIEKIIKLIV